VTSFAASGVFILDKPAGVTSFKALADIKKSLATGKVGHCGTLDRFASGALVVVSGRYTRLASRFESLEKTYEAEFSFGTETDTLDPEGDVIATGRVPDIEAVLDALHAFTGEIEQRPPSYSAIHVNGTRAYRLALAGEAPEMPSRKVTVRVFRLQGSSGRVFSFRIVCSKGTYVRSLARDLALSLGTRAHVSSLRRLSVGPFSVASAPPPPSEERHPLPVTIDEPLARSVGWRTAITSRKEAFLAGKPLSADEFGAESGLFAVFSTDGEFLGLARSDGNNVVYEAVLARGDSRAVDGLE
jgi:tRNA pseudouridine55 synthase